MMLGDVVKCRMAHTVDSQPLPGSWPECMYKLNLQLSVLCVPSQLRTIE
jgi:hypothetical protein